MNTKPRILICPSDGASAATWEWKLAQETRERADVWRARDIDDVIDLLAAESAQRPRANLLIADVPLGSTLSNFASLARDFRTRHPLLKVALVTDDPEAVARVHHGDTFDYVLSTHTSFDDAAQDFLTSPRTDHLWEVAQAYRGQVPS